MNGLNLKINTIKARPEEEIEHFIDGIATKLLEEIEYLEPELRSFLEKAGLYMTETQRKFLDAVLLSCILSDIAGEMSPFERRSDSEKIKSICRKRNLSYNQLVNVMSYSNEILEIINSIKNHK